jgi:glucose-1-phosphate adenylyltransferase
MLQSHRIQAHLFNGYWMDVGTIRTYHEAHLALAGSSPPFDFTVSDGLIYTHMRNLPASQIKESRLESCLVGEGSLIREGTQAERCVIGLRARVGRNVMLRDSVVCGADRYETDRQRQENRSAGIPDVGIGDGCVIHRAILDKDCRIGSNVRIVNERELRDAEADNHVIRDGIVVVPKGAVVPDGTVI